MDHLHGQVDIEIGHFQFTSAYISRRVYMQSLKNISFNYIEITINYHNKNFALRFALKERLQGTRKWPFV